MIDQAEKICAVVVTFRPSAALLTNLSLLAEQVDHIVIVDNGSQGASLEMLQGAASSPQITLLPNPSNEGIAKALNQGLQHGLGLGHHWLITFDQDSTVTPGMISSLLQCFAGGDKRIAIAAPCYVDRNLGSRLGEDREANGEVRTVLTSGMLTPGWIFSQVGFMDERLFIDSVDLEFCYRIRAHGYRIVQIEDARLLHTLGRLTKFRLLGREFEVTNHSAARKYYQTRNRLWTLGLPQARAFWWKQAAREFKGMTWDFAKVLMAEEDKWNKTRRIFLGVWHAFSGRMGKRVEL